jgi:hypothetical protein
MDGNGGESFPFTARLAVGKPPDPLGDSPAPDDTGELIAPGDIYATVTGQRLALALEFIRKDKRSFTVPYSYLPLLWWQPPGSLTIEYPNLFSVRLLGKELDELRRRIKDQRIVWVREFDERQAVALASAVTHIEILRSYPSHEVAGGTTW